MSFPVTTFTHTGTPVVSTAGGSTIVTAAAQRTYLLIRNQGTASVYLRLDGGTPTANNNALQLLPGEPYEVVGGLPGSAVKAIAASGTQNVHVVSGAPPA